MKIVVLDGYALNPGDIDWEPLKEIGECEIYDRTSFTDKEEILERIGDARIVLTNKTPLDEEVLNTAPNLQYIGILATGYNIIDIDAAAKAGITVTNVPAYGTEAVAQFTFALLLEITSQVGLHNQLVHEGQWSSNPDFSFFAKPLTELQGKTLGLIGFGRIAQKVAEIGHAFGMNVIFYNHRPKSNKAEWVQQVNLNELLSQSDVVSLHVPQTPDTKELINSSSLQKMKNTAILINTARGGLINEADLAEALNTEQLSAAAMDVAQHEPINEDSPLLTAKNCYITPHIAWAPQETRKRLLDIVVNNLTEFLAGRKQNTVT
ncbi:hydroxyacid dehydrogenase [Tetragenococcus osmophilus]|uniref:Glycerate dehydrogenase n=1 Tax=Tetragenococcus osmophilus TaxID=526944 RepID=A0AA37XKH7_9ENTE|nr:D-2-hydroxyacid dehydrogenase [Tetragenococcus osmophilus]AYW48606.1 hydroxyacid dehydrogenase [Tetragenococcus osmophilus]GMA54523.1 glycerate dehydrogenase [Alicyclobacillus contaminans]GMA71629.1 glycerate dehydrogenase [Tetragenococcus osmophilus]